jgi:hypothetical protein
VRFKGGSRALSTEEKAPCKTLLDHCGGQDKPSGRAGLPGRRFQENNPRRVLPPPYEGEEKAFGRAVLGERSHLHMKARRKLLGEQS